MNTYYTEKMNFFGNTNAFELVKSFESPLYVYNEAVLRERCREMAGLIAYPRFAVNYSVKANSSLELLKIIRDEGLNADAMSPGEIYVLLKAGFPADEIFYVGNNVSEEEMKYAVDNGVLVSVDSISQLELYGRTNPGGKVAVRFNPGIGAGHHEKVMTAGKKTKFGVNLEYIEDVRKLVRKYNLKLIGINQHIGSLFMEGDAYIEAVKSILTVARQFDDLEFVDIGGGFGVPYHKQDGQKRLDIKELGEKLSGILEDWVRSYGKEVTFKIEPGRYIAAECGVLLGSVYSVKNNYGVTYIGTDLGFNVLTRPVMYDSHHDIEVYKYNKSTAQDRYQNVTVVGNICESGDIIAKDRKLPVINEGDILGIMDAGAYGFSMSSNYNNRLKPAEVLIKQDGNPILIRRRDTLEDLMRNFL